MISNHKNKHGLQSSPAATNRSNQDSNDEPKQFNRRELLKFEDEEALCGALREFIRYERELEDAKMRLAQQ